MQRHVSAEDLGCRDICSPPSEGRVDYGKSKTARLVLDSRFRGNDGLVWGVQRGEAPLRYLLHPPRMVDSGGVKLGNVIPCSMKLT